MTAAPKPEPKTNRRQSGSLKRSDVFRLLDWLRANQKRIESANMTRDEIVAIANGELIFTTTWAVIRSTLKDAGIELKVKHLARKTPDTQGWRARNEKINNLLGQLSVMMIQCANMCDCDVFPLVEIESQKYIIQQERELNDSFEEPYADC